MILVLEVILMKFAIHTFGCKVNIYESEYIINLMQNNGYQLVDFNEEAEDRSGWLRRYRQQ